MIRSPLTKALVLYVLEPLEPDAYWLYPKQGHSVSLLFFDTQLFSAGQRCAGSESLNDGLVVAASGA